MDEQNFQSVKIINNSDGPRTIYTRAGQKIVMPRSSIEAEVSDAELKSMQDRKIRPTVGAKLDEGLPELTVVKLGAAGGAAKESGKGANKDDQDFTKMTKAELADHIEARDGERPASALSKDELVDLAQNAPK